MVRIAVQKPKRHRIGTSLDLPAVVFDGDRDMRESLLASKPLAPFWKEAEEMNATAPKDAHRKQLLKTSIRLSPGIAPGFFKCIEHCKRVLGVDAEIDVFCMQDSQINAFVIPPRDNRITMGFTSAGLQSLTDGEICSIIGHELGHVLFDHFALRPLLAFQEDERLAPLDAMRLYAWMRYAELSADRVGLLCCDDFDTAILAEFKLASGLTDARVIGDVRETARQYAAIQAEKMEEDSDDWFSTHPYSPLRIKALDLFAQSKTFHKVRGRQGGNLTEKDLEKEVAAVMSMMNPSFLDEKSSCAKEIKEFLVYGGVDIALADQKVKKSELNAIRKLAGEGKLSQHLDEIVALSEEERADKIVAVASTLRLKLPLIRRRKVIEDITAVALADKKVDDSEIAVLYGLADVLGVDSLFVDQTLTRPEGALD